MFKKYTRFNLYETDRLNTVSCESPAICCDLLRYNTVCYDLMQTEYDCFGKWVRHIAICCDLEKFIFGGHMGYFFPLGGHFLFSPIVTAFERRRFARLASFRSWSFLAVFQTSCKGREKRGRTEGERRENRGRKAGDKRKKRGRKEEEKEDKQARCSDARRRWWRRSRGVVEDAVASGLAR